MYHIYVYIIAKGIKVILFIKTAMRNYSPSYR